MSADEKRPEPGQKFYVPSDDEGESDEEIEIDEVLEENDGEFNVAADGEFYDILWSMQNNRWEEVA